MPVSASFMRKLERVSPELRDVLLSLVEEVERTVTKEEFDELRNVVKELAEAQRETGERINQLAEAQRKTEERLQRLEATVQELIEAQRKTEERLSRLEATVQELIEAQRKTEERLQRLEATVQELAEAQRRTEERINQLAEAQRRTEEEIRKLATGQRRLREQVGGLSRSVAYALENEAYRNLPSFLRERYGIEVLDKFVRFELRGEEINLFARARRDGKEVFLVGEAVLRLDDRGKLRKMKEKVELVAREYRADVLAIIVTHFAKSKLREEAEKAGFLVVQSFEW